MALVFFRCPQMTTYGINPSFDGLYRSKGQVGYALLTRAPVAISLARKQCHDAPRLACVKPVASVHPEPGSNSPLYILVFLYCLLRTAIRSIY